MDENGVPDSDISFRDEIDVVKGGGRDGGASQTNGFKDRFWCQDTCSADLDNDVEKLCGLLLGRIFVCHSPFGGACVFTDLHALVKIIDLHDGTIDIKGEAIAKCTELFDVGDDLFGVFCQRAVRNDVEAFLFQIGELLIVCRECLSGHLLDVEDQNIEISFRCDLGIELTE